MKTDGIKARGTHGNLIHDCPGDFALRLCAIRPIERDYGSATSGANETAAARGLFGTQESRGENRACPTGNA